MVSLRPQSFSRLRNQETSENKAMISRYSLTLHRIKRKPFMKPTDCFLSHSILLFLFENGKKKVRFELPSSMFHVYNTFYYILYVYNIYTDIHIFALCVLSCVWCFATPWTAAQQAPLFMKFFRKVSCSGFPFLPPGYLPSPGFKLSFPVPPALVGSFFTTVPLRKPILID